MSQPVSSIRLPRAIKLLLGPSFEEAVPYDVRVEGVGEDCYLRIYKRPDGGHVGMIVGRASGEADGTADDPPFDPPHFKRDERPSPPAEEPEQKGGRLAMRAAILCDEGGFRVFLGARDSDHAADLIRAECRISSRRELDHNPDAASRFRQMTRSYEAWLRDE